MTPVCQHGLHVSTRVTDHTAFCPQFPKHKPISHSLDILQDIEVENLKPAVVKIYDYYQPSKWREKIQLYRKEKKKENVKGLSCVVLFSTQVIKLRHNIITVLQVCIDIHIYCTYICILCVHTDTHTHVYLCFAIISSHNFFAELSSVSAAQ